MTARYLLTLALVLSSTVFTQAVADKVALVIGNNTYPSDGELVTPLNNCVRDAHLVAQTLTRIGFQVREMTEASRSDIEDSLISFQNAIVKGGTALIYFAGHGIEVDGQSYVLGTNSKLKARSLLAEEGLKAETLAQFMIDAGAGASFLFLDCCREAPPTEWLSRGIKKRGLADTKVDGDIIIGFAAKPGQSAQDAPLVTAPGVSNLNSPYAQALCKWLPHGLKHTDFFHKVRQEVNILTGGQQRTWENGSFLNEYVFGSGGGSVPTPPPTIVPVPTPMPQVPQQPMTREASPPSTELVKHLADLAALDLKIARAQADWKAANDLINRFTSNRTVRIQEGSFAHKKCVEADQVLMRSKALAEEMLTERVRLETTIRVLGGDPESVRKTTPLAAPQAQP
ncbi:MAG: caspase family protein [Verrucomicrobiaceae bacterium]|nr:caspase family protein [Verrucomicrobiaceae bacterium]